MATTRSAARTNDPATLTANVPHGNAADEFGSHSPIVYRRGPPTSAPAATAHTARGSTCRRRAGGMALFSATVEEEERAVVGLGVDAADQPVRAALEAEFDELLGLAEQPVDAVGDLATRCLDQAVGIQQE